MTCSRNRFLQAVIAIVGFCLVVAVGTSIATSEDAPADCSYTPQQRRSIASDIWSDIKLRYSYFDEKGIDWDAVGRVFIAKAENASSDREFFAAVSDMVRELHDGHSYVYSYPKSSGRPWGYSALTIADIEGIPTVVEVDPGSSAARAGVVTGMHILRVDGRNAQELVDANQAMVTSSTPWNAKAVAVRSLLSGDLKEPVTVELATNDGSVVEVSLERVQPSRTVDPIEARLLPGNIGYVRLASFSTGVLGMGSSEEFLKAFDNALETVKGSNGLIVDLRGNGGGNDVLAGKCAGRLLSSTTEFPNFQMRMVTLGVPWFGPIMRRSVTPRGSWQYRAPIVLIIDEFVFSSAEHFVAGLHDSGRAITVGSCTAGSSGNPIQREVGGFGYQISRWREYRITGELIEGFGIPADMPVKPTRAGTVAGRDEVLETAVQIILERTARP